MKPKTLTRLPDANAVIEAFGSKELMVVTNVTSPQAVSNWRKRGFPKAKYVVMTTWLREHGFTADPSLWGQLPADDHPSKEPASSAPIGASAPA